VAELGRLRGLAGRDQIAVRLMVQAVRRRAHERLFVDSRKAFVALRLALGIRGCNNARVWGR